MISKKIFQISIMVCVFVLGLLFHGQTVTEAGAIPIRGVVEGFYGTPWSFEEPR